MLQQSLPYFPGGQPAGATKHEYDCLGRVVKTTNPDETLVKTSHVKDWTRIIDENGHMKSERRDTFNNLLKVIQHVGKKGDDRPQHQSLDLHP